MAMAEPASTRTDRLPGRVFVVMPVFNRWHFTETCIASLRKQTYAPLVIVIADGGSTDETLPRLKEQPDIDVVAGKSPEWWGESAARGIDYVLGRCDADDFVLLLNNDTMVPENYAEALVAASVAHNATVGSMIRDIENPAGLVEGGVTIDWESYRFNVKKDIGEDEHFFDGVDVLPGRGTLVPVGALRTVGNVDAKVFPHYLADYDLTYRIKKAGFKLGVAYDAVVFAHLNETGFQAAEAGSGFRVLWRSLTGRKSMGNFRDHWNFISRHAPSHSVARLHRGLLRYTALCFMMATPLRHILSPLVAARSQREAAQSGKSRR